VSSVAGVLGVDPHGLGARRRLWEAAREALRVAGIGGGEHGGPGGHTLVGQAEVHVVRGEQAKTAVMVFDVVPREEDVAVGADILDRAEPFRERRPILRRLELRFREWVVVGDVGAASRLLTKT
jgi:hypothetical protein